MRAPRHWTIVERFDRFYVENQYGGFAGWNTTLEDAIAQGRRYVAEDGDTFEDPELEGKRQPERCSPRCGAPIEECARDHVEERAECGECGRQVKRYGTDGIWFGAELGGGYGCTDGRLHAPKRQSEDCPVCAGNGGEDWRGLGWADCSRCRGTGRGRDWRTMTPSDFGVDTGPETLFTLEPGQVPAVDPCGTGDLLEELA